MERLEPSEWTNVLLDGPKGSKTTTSRGFEGNIDRSRPSQEDKDWSIIRGRGQEVPSDPFGVLEKEKARRRKEKRRQGRKQISCYLPASLKKSGIPLGWPT
ncbi:hypothetical protein CR513_48508, partial [Mucuna pruriens]